MTNNRASKSKFYLQKLLVVLERKKKNFDSEIVRLTIEILSKDINQTKRVRQDDLI